MAELNGFDASNVEPTVPFEPIPAGKYLGVITDSQMKPTKAGDGEYLELELEIIEGDHKGRKLWDRLTLKHPKQRPVELARGTLSSICRSVGVLKPKDSTELHNIPLEIAVKCKKRSDTGEIVNDVRGYARKETPGYAPVPTNSNAPWKRP